MTVKNGKPNDNSLKANSKEYLDRVRGTVRIYDPEKGPASK